MTEKSNNKKHKKKIGKKDKKIGLSKCLFSLNLIGGQNLYLNI
jgi:hypothetical protein